MSGEIILEARNLARHYTVSRGAFRPAASVKALADASFVLKRGQTLAVVGESGCGKSTLARVLTLIEPPTSGTLSISGEDVALNTAAAREILRPKIQIVFQNPYGSLNPRQTIADALTEPLLVNGRLDAEGRSAKAAELMAAVGLRPEHAGRYPHMFSGGQRQRIAIARALILEPDILILDEPVSALDISIQAQILNLLRELQERMNLAFLFISHDLSVVRHIADDVMVMYLGRAVEHGSRDAVFSKPRHPYTRALLSATPIADPKIKKERIVLKGELPSPLNPPQGCAFHPRCPIAVDRCKTELPVLRRIGGADVACHLAE
ncbi:MAG: dipeptide ABC transporter ATP-binding protein [Rhizobiaceae bacterium]